MTRADTAFEAHGKSINEVFKNSAIALTDVMVDRKTVESKKTKTINLRSDKLEYLLYDFLDEIVFLKDAEVFLLSDLTVKVDFDGETYSLVSELKGDSIDLEKQTLGTDVKAVTYHHYRLENKDGKWKATIVLDV